MALLNFQGRFVDDIEAGRKKQTIRNFRKYPINPGEKLHLYTMLRTKYARKLGEEKCKEVRVIQIRKDGIKLKQSRTLSADGQEKRTFKVDLLHAIPILDAFANSDGFKNWAEMKKFWVITHGLPFTGQLLKW
jgi:uncharacterized protein YqfB (UPF0267 family)